jgi:hypothetical protein
MGESGFEEFYDHLCRNWEIARSPEELEEIDFVNVHSAFSERKVLAD